jgi:hypothetical protein
MGLPVFFPQPEIALVLPRGRRTSLPELCEEAGVKCRVTGISAQRRIWIAAALSMRIVRKPGTLSGIWLGVPKASFSRRALLALGMLAYGAFDYGARETLRGLPEARATVGPGRPRSPRPLDPAERQRRHRSKTRQPLIGS